MKSGESTSVHHAGRVANFPARLTMEASSSSGKRNESITSFQPAAHTLRRASTWQPDPSGIWAATGAAVHHAGLMAELLHTGTPWHGPVFYLDQTDYLRADDMLVPTFGRHASGAHAFAQTVALNVLNDRWDRVQEIAAHLVEHGQWQFAPAGSTNQISKD